MSFLLVYNLRAPGNPLSFCRFTWGLSTSRPSNPSPNVPQSPGLFLLKDICEKCKIDQRIHTITWLDFLKYWHTYKKICMIQGRIIFWRYLQSVIKYLLTSNQTASLQLSLLAVLSRSESCKCFLTIGFIRC